MPKRSTVVTETPKPGYVPATEADFNARLTHAYEAGAASVKPEPPYIPSPEDACDEAACRLAFVLDMLHMADDRPSESLDPAGYEFRIIHETIETIRTLLDTSVKAAQAKERAAVTAQGAAVAR